MTDRPRLIEVAFPLRQASLDSVHEKNVRHGHISTLHIWPARRPLAAARAALIATLLPDPGDAERRKSLLERIGGRVVHRIERRGKKEVEKEETAGGILHWGNETSRDLEWFRQEIRNAYGGRAPRVLDPFAGGGAIPLEAMRLGCEATAIDINPVAWFVLECTLEYPRELAGQKRRLPAFAQRDAAFMEAFCKRAGLKKRRGRKGATGQDELFGESLDADLAWHVRAWGHWVLERARSELEDYYPTVGGRPVVAYLWARTAKCKNCRATIPLLKTRWLVKKDEKRVVLEMDAERGGHPKFRVRSNVPVKGRTEAERKKYDKELGGGTMSRSGASCRACNSSIMTMEDLRIEGLNGRLGEVMTAVVVDDDDGKAYRLPHQKECNLITRAAKDLKNVAARIPHGLPDEPMASTDALGFRVPLYGFDRWSKLYSHLASSSPSRSSWTRRARREPRWHDSAIRPSGSARLRPISR